MENKRVYRKKENPMDSIFNKDKVIIGVVHCRPLPGSPEYKGETIKEICQRAIKDAQKYEEAGLDGIIVENHGDIPFIKPQDIGPETPALMTSITNSIKREINLPTGLNILANAAKQSLAVAKATNSKFIRVNEWVNAYIANEGFIEGKAGKILRYRSWLSAQDIKVFADVHVKHGSHSIVADRSIPELTRDAEFFGADSVIVTGYRTGDAPKTDEVREIKNSTKLPVLVGSGASKENVDNLIEIADGIIVASSLKEEGVWWNPVDFSRAKEFMKKVKASR